MAWDFPGLRWKASVGCPIHRAGALEISQEVRGNYNVLFGVYLQGMPKPLQYVLSRTAPSLLTPKRTARASNEIHSTKNVVHYTKDCDCSTARSVSLLRLRGTTLEEELMREESSLASLDVGCSSGARTSTYSLHCSPPFRRRTEGNVLHLSSSGLPSPKSL